MRNQNRKSSLSSGIVLFSVGGILTALGVALLVITIKDFAEHGISSVGAVIPPMIIIIALLGFGITALVIGGKKIFLRIRQSRTYRRGKEATARIVDYKSASFSKSHTTRIRYALILCYNDNGEDKYFITDYLFDVNEFKYLKKLERVNVKINADFVVVCEPFPKDIYLVDSTYGIEMAFYKQKPVAVLLRLWAVFFVAAFVFLIASFFIGNSSVALAAIITVFSVHFPFVIPLAIYLIKWMTRKK